jgi:phosphatidylglycerol:prolipoprotein diacylglycerol transferase
MFQTLFSIGSFQVHTYGLSLALGFLLGIYLATRRAKQMGEDPAFISDLAVWIIIGAVVGARLLYVFLNFGEFKGNLLSIVNPVQEDGTIGIGGLVFIGGLFMATFLGILYIRRKKKSVMKIADIVMPAIAFGHATGRMGCFLNGCCYGKTCTMPWAIHFPSDSPAGYYQSLIHADNLHPTQLYMVFGAVMIGVLLILFERYKRFDGHNLYLFFIFYGIDRTLVDFFRYYPEQELHLGLTHNQWILIALSVVLTVIFILKWRGAGTGKSPDKDSIIE